MDTDTVVEDLVASGLRLTDALGRAGSDVMAAAWVKTVEEGRWVLYVVSRDVEAKGLTPAYRRVADVLHRLADPLLSVSNVKLVGERQRAARDILEAQPRHPFRTPQRSRLTSVGGMPVEEVFVYPAAQLTIGPRQSVLRFALQSSDHPTEILSRFFPQGKTLLNRTEWRGKEARSCGVASVKTRQRAGGGDGPLIHDVEVAYRPKGVITCTGGTKYDGWTPYMLDRAKDGTFLDGHGKPLPEGHPPVYLPVEVFPDADFNEIDFGEFVGEFDVEGIKHVSFDHVMGRINDWRESRMSIHSTFVAPRRQRPVVKIVLSNNPSGTVMDGDGTRIFNVNCSTPQLHQVLLDHVTELLNGFVEGRYSVKNISNGEFVFAQFDDVLVDCTPNDEGKGPRFNCLIEYLPDSALDELAKRLVATYAVEVSVVDGAEYGLLLRRLNPSETD